MLGLLPRKRAISASRQRTTSDTSQVVSGDDGEYCPLVAAPTMPTLNLYQCARNGYVDVADTLLQDKAVLNDIDAEDEEGLTPLHYAARYNHFKIVKLLVEKGANIQATDDEGLTPLHYACRIKRKRRKSRKTKELLFDDDMDGTNSMQTPMLASIDPDASAIHFLIQNGADILHRDDYGCTPLHHAALRGDEVACEQLLLYNTRDENFVQKLVNATDNQKMTPLHTAATQCESDVARQLLKAGADVNKMDEELSTPLHEAATAGDTKIARLIFDACTKGDAMDSRRLAELLSTKDEDGNTPLMLAVESARYKFTLACINKGASLNTSNKWHMSALHLAAIKGDVRIVRLLLEHGANVYAVNNEHQTPLHKAALFNNTEAMELLMDSGSNIESKDKDDFTPLLLAACYGHTQAVDLLLKRGADVKVEDCHDRTALYLAAEENKLQTLEVLLKYPQCKEMVNQRDENSNSPLHIAAGSGFFEIVKCLLENNANMAVKNDLEQTPIHMAAINGQAGIVKAIVKLEKNAMTDGDEDSNTALHLAANGGHDALVETLLKYGASPEVRNTALKSPLGCAAAAGCQKTCKILAAFDAQIDPVDKQKCTPLLIAATNGHAEVVEFLLKKNADVAFCDPDGNNCLDLAIKHDHQDVAYEIIKSNSWRCALRNVTIDKGVENTPMRKLIHKMPEVATEVFNKCIELHKPEEGSQQKLTYKHEVTYDYEFIDDLYCIPAWKNMPKRKKQKDSSVEDEIIKADEIWSPLAYFRNEGSSARRKLVPYTKDSETFMKNHPMMVMVDSSREELLSHPLIRSLIRYKWESFSRVLFYCNFSIYVIFVLCLTVYVSLTKPPFSINKDNFGSLEGSNDCEKYESDGAKHHPLAVVTKYFILILAFMHIIKEIVQGFYRKWYYIKDGENIFEVALFITSILLTLDFESCQTVTGYRMDWQWIFGSIAIILAWTNLVLSFQKFPKFGIYVVMFKSILFTFMKFYLVFQMFIIAFGMGFFCLLQNQDSFSNPWFSVLRTAVMMIGEFDYTDTFFEDEYHYWITFFVFAVFMVVMSIIIMNLLVGLAVDDIKGVQEQAALKRTAMKVYAVLDTERASLSFTSRYFKERITKTFDSMEDAMTAIKDSEEFENKIQKSQMKVLKKVDKVKHGLKEVKTDIAKIHEMLEAISKAQNIRIGQEDA